MAEVVRERKTGNGGHLPSQERETGIAMMGDCGWCWDFFFFFRRVVESSGTHEPIVDPVIAR